MREKEFVEKFSHKIDDLANMFMKEGYTADQTLTLCVGVAYRLMCDNVSNNSQAKQIIGGIIDGFTFKEYS